LARIRRESSVKAVKDVARHSSARGDQYHAVRFYEGERSLARITADFFAEGFAEQHPALVAATPSFRAALLLELSARSLDVVEMQRSRELLLLDARDTLATFMVDGKPDAVKFTETMCAAIEHVSRGRSGCKVRVFGQMVDVLWRDGHQGAAIDLEMLWNQLARTRAFSLLCGYAMGNFYKDSNVDDICGQHSHVVSADGEATAIE